MTMMRSRLLCLELLWICSFLSPLLVSGATKTNTLQAIDDITNWRIFPQRHREEAAVIEWGHSAIISAIDASVAHFGPQTSQAALFEVETTPVLADPINGKVDDANGALVNADQMHGNVVVMTDTDRSCLDLALTAQRAQAAALIVVHVNEARPDDAPRCAIPPGRATEAATIDIPVVTISLASVDVLTMATVTEDMQPEEVVNHGMPERIRLYAGGDRPFFEDIESAEPTVYLIHNLLTAAECAVLMGGPTTLYQPIDEPNALQYLSDISPYVQVARRVHYSIPGSTFQKAVDERIEQVTGFPAAHFSEWMIDRLESPQSTIHPHHDMLPGPGNFVPHATISVFLSVPEGDDDDLGALIFPSTARGEPIQVQPRPGLAVVHHNILPQKQEWDMHAFHGWMPAGNGVVYLARRFVLPAPVSPLRRWTLPVYTAMTHGQIPTLLLQWHAWLVQQFGREAGNTYWDQSLVALPALLLLGIVYGVGQRVQAHLRRNAVAAPPAKATVAKPTPTKSKKKKQ